MKQYSSVNDNPWVLSIVLTNNTTHFQFINNRPLHLLNHDGKCIPPPLRQGCSRKREVRIPNSSWHPERFVSHKEAQPMEFQFVTFSFPKEKVVFAHGEPKTFSKLERPTLAFCGTSKERRFLPNEFDPWRHTGKGASVCLANYLVMEKDGLELSLS